MNGNYLIPANSKKSLKILGIFYPFDLILFITGVGRSLILMMLLNISDFRIAILSILPGCIAGLLVFPVPYYHNVLTVIKEAIEFLSQRQKFIWKGWCVTSEIEKEKQK